MSSEYQEVLPEAKSFSTLEEMGRPSAFIRATEACTPAASHNSNGPSSQLKPMRMARSISTTVSEISGIRLAAYVQSSDNADHRNKPALSGLPLLPSRPSNILTRAPVSSTFLAISSEGNFGFPCGWYSRVFQSMAWRASSPPSPLLIFL